MLYTFSLIIKRTIMIHIDIGEQGRGKRKINIDLPLFFLLVMPKKLYIIYLL